MTTKIIALLVLASTLFASGCASTDGAARREVKPEQYYFNALADMNHGNYVRAEENLKKAIELKPGSYNARLMLGKVYERQGAPEKALSAYQGATSIDKSDSRAYLGAMNALLDLHRPAEAAAMGEAGMSAGAPKVNLVGLTGWSYYEAGDLDKAEPCYRSAIELTESDTASMNNLGILLFVKSKYMDALSMFKLAHDKNPDSSMAPYLLALTYNRLGREAEALDSLKEAVKLDPKLQSEFKAYNKAYFMHGDPGDISGLFDKLKAGK